jgi:hypothetical protein
MPEGDVEVGSDPAALPAELGDDREQEGQMAKTVAEILIGVLEQIGVKHI